MGYGTKVPIVINRGFTNTQYPRQNALSNQNNNGHSYGYRPSQYPVTNSYVKPVYVPQRTIYHPTHTYSHHTGYGNSKYYGRAQPGSVLGLLITVVVIVAAVFLSVVLS